MRNEIKTAAYREAAKKALINLISTLQREILPITFGWHDRECKVYASVGWYDPDQYDEMEGFYGTTPGLYITAEVGEYFIWLPKSTKAYELFYPVMAELCKQEDLLEDSVPDEIILDCEGDSIVSLKFVTYIYDVTNEIEMVSAKKVAIMLNEMLTDYKICEGFILYEGDDEPNNDRVYNPGDEIPPNYFVGIKTSYDFYKVK